MHPENPLFPPIISFRRGMFGDGCLSTQHEAFAKGGSNCKLIEKESWLTETLLHTRILGWVANAGPSTVMWSCMTSRSTSSSYHSPLGSNAKCGSLTGSHEVADEERGLCYGVKRGKESRSGTSQNPQTPTPNLTPTKNNKSHVL